MPKPKNQRTPEEEKRVAEAAQFIQEREKLASKIGGNGPGAVREAARQMIPAEEEKLKAKQSEKLAAQNAPLLGQVGQMPEQAQTPQIPQVISPFEKKAVEIIQANPFLMGISETGEQLRGDVGEGAVGAGLGQAALGAVGGATLGAIAGGTPTVPLAAVGAVGGFIRGFTGKLKENMNENVKADFQTLPKNMRNLKMIIADANNGADAASSIQIFNEQLNAIDEAEASLHRESQKDLNKFLSVDAQVELASFKNFNSPGGARNLLVRRMQEALLSPNPAGNFNLLDASDFEENI